MLVPLGHAYTTSVSAHQCSASTEASRSVNVRLRTDTRLVLVQAAIEAAQRQSETSAAIRAKQG